MAITSIIANADSLTVNGDEIENSKHYDWVLVESGILTGSNLTITSIDTTALAVTGGEANLTNTTVNTSGSNAFGARALSGKIKLTNGNITTVGERGYGLLSDANGQIESNVNITTAGTKAHGVQAGGGIDTPNGTVKLTGGAIKTTGSDAYGLHAVFGGAITGTTTITTEGTNSFGAFAESDSSIAIDVVTIRTTGAKAYGLLVNNDAQTTGGKITANHADVLVTGTDTEAVRVESGGEVTVSNSHLESKNAAGIALKDNAKIDVIGTVIISSQQSFSSNLNSAGQIQTITIGQDSVATQNNGTLLLVNRSANGADGNVTLTLAAGSTSQGNITDMDARTTGGTDVTVAEGAVWSGLLQGVRNFTSLQKGNVNFEGQPHIAGNLNGTGANYTFSNLGGTIDGTVNLTSNSSTSGGTIDHQINVGGNVNVDQTSRLGGNWNITGDLVSKGVLAPGNLIGIINVGGNLTMAESSVYEVNAGEGGKSDLISVLGTANIAGTIILKPLDHFNLTSPYKILTAGSIQGTFSSAEFSDSADFLNTLLHYSATDVTLTVERNDITFASVAQTDNQISVANTLDDLPLSNPIVATLALSSFAGAHDSFDPLSGEIHASVLTGLIADSQNIRDTVSDRIRAAFNVANSTNATGNAVWGSVYGSRGTINGTDNTAELKHSTTGILVGIDGVVSGDWLVGVLAGYSGSVYKVDDRASSADADNYHLGIYGGREWGAVGFRSGLAYTWSKIEVTRLVSVLSPRELLSSNNDAGIFQVFGELGYKMAIQQTVFEPFLNLAYVKARTNASTENGGSAALTTERASTGTGFSTLGLRSTTDFAIGNSLASLHGAVGWRHASGDVNPIVWNSFTGGGDFAITGAPIARNAALLEVGIKFKLSQAANLDLFYTGQFTSGTQQNGVNSKLSINF